MSDRIVIIGGMGPQASLELHRRIIKRAADLGATDNDDFPEILHYSVPIPDFISSNQKSTGMLRLEKSLSNLTFLRSDKVVIACNTAHLLQSDLEQKYGFRLISLIDSVVQTVKISGVNRVGLLASPTTIASGLYSQPLKSIGVQVIVPSDAELSSLERAVRLVIAGVEVKEAELLLRPQITKMLKHGAEKIILGCTELSVIYSSRNESAMIDPLSIVTECLI